MIEQCEGHDRMVDSVESIAFASVRSEERFQGFLRFAKWIGGTSLMTLTVIAWVGVLLLGKVEKISDAYQAADAQLLIRGVNNEKEIAINKEGLKRIEVDLAHIRRLLDKSEGKSSN